MFVLKIFPFLNHCLLYTSECKQRHADHIEEMLLKLYPTMGIVSDEDAVYNTMRVKEYLHIFAALSRHEKLVQEAVTKMHLQDIFHIKNSALTASQKYRVMCAREIIKDKEILYLKEPLHNLEQDDVKIILEWIATLENYKKRVFITSNSVSYTHLDVYKRQVYMPCKICILFHH